MACLNLFLCLYIDYTSWLSAPISVLNGTSQNRHRQAGVCRYKSQLDALWHQTHQFMHRTHGTKEKTNLSRYTERFNIILSSTDTLLKWIKPRYSSVGFNERLNKSVDFKPVVVSLASQLLFYFYASIWFITVLLKWHESTPHPKAGLCEWIHLIGFVE